MSAGVFVWATPPLTIRDHSGMVGACVCLHVCKCVQMYACVQMCGCVCKPTSAVDTSASVDSGPPVETVFLKKGSEPSPDPTACSNMHQVKQRWVWGQQFRANGARLTTMVI